MIGKWNWTSEPAANFDATLEIDWRRPVRERALAIARAEEAEIKWLLGCWVSGLTPAVARNSAGGIIGLCDADAPVGSKPFILYRRR